jgi:predicted lipid-binding transport protein (Tim44 family)
LAAIAAADPSFDEKTFLNGAKAAFGMIVEAYARGDLDTLRPLLSDEVFANFSDAVAARKKAGETLETRIERMSDADIVEADLDGSTAVITVRFATEQTNVTRDAAGTVLDGDPAKPEEVVDLWSFARNTRSRDPNWTLIETRVPA